MDILQIALGVGLILLIALSVVVLVWVVRLDRAQQGKASLRHYTVHIDGTKVFNNVSETEVKRLVHDKLTVSAAQAAEKFEASLNKTIPKLTADIEEMNSRTLQKEFNKYQLSFNALNDEAMQSQAKLVHEIQQRRAALLGALDKKIISDYQERLARFDQRFSDIISSYIAESLPENADLGAQLPAILAELEANKEQIKKDILA
ncbi:hypothetical protein TM7_0325 [candidate division TM7 genomosp. GTL1]|nr:hypothetical protein TM7_0325 [candidate division TM7 genomosp. GTL1]